MELKPIDLGNGILLFKNVLKDSKKTYEFILDSKTNDDPYFGKDIWHDWQPWGNYAKAYPNLSGEYKTSDAYGAELQRECIDIFFGVLDIYKEHFKGDAFFARHGFPEDYPTSLEELEQRIENKDFTFNMADLVLFETNKNVHPDWQMYIHQDTIPFFGQNQNHMFNFNIYVNDDYQGGEIIFFKTEGCEKVEYVDSVTGLTEEAWIVEDYFEYKMKAGDAMIFPVDLYHGVKPIAESGTKFYIRQFITHVTDEEFNVKKAEFLASGKTEEDFEQLLIEYKKTAYENRKNPVLFNSIEEINLHYAKDVHKTQVPCIINSYKNISGLIS
jgi:hypothetical protein